MKEIGELIDVLNASWIRPPRGVVRFHKSCGVRWFDRPTRLTGPQIPEKAFGLHWQIANECLNEH